MEVTDPTTGKSVPASAIIKTVNHDDVLDQDHVNDVFEMYSELKNAVYDLADLLMDSQPAMWDFIVYNHGTEPTDD